jgi:hypothetical protein
VLAVNAGGIPSVCFIVWRVGPQVDRTTSAVIGVLGILILNVTLLLGFSVSRTTSEPNQRSHFGSILMLILILFAILLYFIPK